MVDQVGHYYGTASKGHQGVNQEDTLSTTIFNMVVDVLICRWITLVAVEEA